MAASSTLPSDLGGVVIGPLSSSLRWAEADG